jgi:phosphoglucomutase
MSSAIEQFPAELDYYACRPNLDDARHVVHFGTSGHRGVCDYRSSQGADGPLYMGKNTHPLSEPAHRTALEVLAANEVETVLQRDNGVTPTPVISQAILMYNRVRKEQVADGVVITPSHNSPEDGGFKYHPAFGTPSLGLLSPSHYLAVALRSGQPTRICLIVNLLAAETTSRTGRDPAEYDRELTAEFGNQRYVPMDYPARPEEVTRLEEQR